MASTGLPGMRRGSRKFSTRATKKTTMVQATFRPRYFASAIPCRLRCSSDYRRSGLRAHLLDLEQPLDARALPHRRGVRVLRRGEVLPVVGVEFVELQRAVHQRQNTHVL